MLYFVALLWNRTDLAATSAGRSLIRDFQTRSTHWEFPLLDDGMAIGYTISAGPTVDRVQVLPAGRGVIFGRVFNRDADINGVPAMAAFTDRDSAHIADKRGMPLVTEYWGRYVAFIRNVESGTSWVIRDPTGALPCFRAKLRGIDVYFIRLDDCERLAHIPRTINHQFILSMLTGGFGLTRETGLNEVSNVLPGECIEHSPKGSSSTFYWDPLHLASQPQIDDAREAIPLVRHAVRSSVWAWSSCFEGILLRLSGGVDSSIVLSCLADAPTAPRLTCQTEFIAHTQADERRFARLAAAKARCELLERNVDTPFSFSNLLSAPRAVSPHVRLFDRQAAAKASEELRLTRIEAIFEGHGGDEIFYKAESVPTAVDHAWAHGFSMGMLRTAWDDCVRSKLNYWKVLGRVFKYGLLHRTWPSAPARIDSLIKREALLEASGYTPLAHPLFTQAAGMPPGKYSQALSIACHGAIFWPPDRVDELPVTISPLVSQPIMEQCLQVATYVLCNGSRDRAVARDAFREAIPKEVFGRRHKGTPEAQVWGHILENAKIASELLLDGYLVRHGLLDRDQLVRVLSGRPEQATSYAGEFLNYLDIESWARNWTSVSQAAAA